MKWKYDIGEVVRNRYTGEVATVVDQTSFDDAPAYVVHYHDIDLQHSGTETAFIAYNPDTDVVSLTRAIMKQLVTVQRIVDDLAAVGAIAYWQHEQITQVTRNATANVRRRASKPGDAQ
jgi:hypothetical protein